MHLALQHTLSLAVEIKGVAAIQKALANGLDITIVGDNDFYSQRAKVSSSLLLGKKSSILLAYRSLARVIGITSNSQVIIEHITLLPDPSPSIRCS